MPKRSYHRQPNVPAQSDVRDIIGNVAHALQGITPAHVALDRKRDRNFASMPASANTYGPKQDGYPWGARILLYAGAPTSAKYRCLIARRCHLKLTSVPHAPDMGTGLETESTRNLRLWVAARFPFLFDAEAEPNWNGDIVQSAPMAQELRDTFGVDYETVVTAFGLVDQHDRPGGRSGKSALDLLWERNILGFQKRFENVQIPFRELPACLRSYAKTMKLGKQPSRIVAHLMEGVIEIERAIEWIIGYFAQRPDKWKLVAMSRAEVSPLAMIWAIYCPDDVVQGDLQDHAAKAVAILDRLKLNKQAQRDEMPYERCLGDNELGFLVSVLFWLRQRNLKPDIKLSRETASVLYRIAVNTLAWIDRPRARRSLIARFRGGKHWAIRDLLNSDNPASLFDPDPPRDDAWSRLVVADGLTEMGADFVFRIQNQELERERWGLRDRSRNPLIRAGFCPEAWSKPVVEETMTDAWIVCRSSLQTLDLHYASPWLKGKEWKSALGLSLMVSEMPVPPMTDFLFGHDLELPSLFAGWFIGHNLPAANYHFGQKSHITGLPARRKGLQTKVFGARPYFDRVKNRL
jgi:hypothetical protein